jgi:hypothetical protein
LPLPALSPKLGHHPVFLSLTNRSPDATDLGHLLHKHPAHE